MLDEKKSSEVDVSVYVGRGERVLDICRLAQRNGGGFIMLSNGQGHMDNTVCRMRIENSEQEFHRRYAVFKCLHEKVWSR